MLTKCEIENNLKKNRNPFSNYCIFMQILASFSFYFNFYPSQPFQMGLGKSPRNNRSIESGLRLVYLKLDISWLQVASSWKLVVVTGDFG